MRSFVLAICLLFAVGCGGGSGPEVPENPTETPEDIAPANEALEMPAPG